MKPGTIFLFFHATVFSIRLDNEHVQNEYFSLIPDDEEHKLDSKMQH